MHKRVLILLWIAGTLVAFARPQRYAFYMPLIYGTTAVGNACQGHLQGVVYEDRNGDGRRNVDETGFPGVRLVLRYYNGPVVRNVFTNQQGYYQMRVPAGLYALQAENPRGYHFTTPDVWGIDIICAGIQLDFGLLSDQRTDF